MLSQDGDQVVKSEPPGVKPEDVEVTLQNGVLTISGEHKAAQEEKWEGGYYVEERLYDTFRRRIPLAEEADKKVHTRFQGGVPEVRVEGSAAC